MLFTFSTCVSTSKCVLRTRYSSKISALLHVSSLKMSTKPFVLVTMTGIAEEALNILGERCTVEVWPKKTPMSRPDLIQRIAGKDALFCFLTDKIDAELLGAAGSQLKVIGTMSVGYDHIDIGECHKRGIKVGNTPNVLTDATAELGMALLLSTTRRLFEAHNEVMSGGWSRTPWNPSWMCGTEIRGSTVGIVGMGNVGFAITERLKPFKVGRFLYFSRHPKPHADAVGAEFTSFAALLQQSDIIIVTCALNPDTRGLFNKSAFAQMKKTAILINISRGAVVDQDALYEALAKKQICAAGLDVMTPEPLPPDHPLTKLSNCVLLPHIGSATERTRRDMALLTARNIVFGLDGKPLPSAVC
ncbi:glyoxylate reductase/hydroxypyruvate reductase-like [Ornithodoros turicata]|uniref:glyoxylate reductase/hydroxypyruvate reductase-like n=1 Tax=Ornithodoros turicata TaxID=34597 RepID=UPI0031397D83